MANLTQNPIIVMIKKLILTNGWACPKRLRYYIFAKEGGSSKKNKYLLRNTWTAPKQYREIQVFFAFVWENKSDQYIIISSLSLLCRFLCSKLLLIKLCQNAINRVNISKKRKKRGGILQILVQQANFRNFWYACASTYPSCTKVYVQSKCLWTCV